MPRDGPANGTRSWSSACRIACWLRSRHGQGTVECRRRPSLRLPQRRRPRRRRLRHRRRAAPRWPSRRAAAATSPRRTRSGATSKGSNVSSPIYHDGHLYWASDNGGSSTARTPPPASSSTANASRPLRARSRPRPCSPTASSITSRNATAPSSSRPDPKFELLAHNVFADDKSRTNASLGGQRRPTVAAHRPAPVLHRHKVAK